MDRENYLRVTKILYPFSGLQNIKEDVLQNAARRGTKVHKICEGIISGLGEIGVDDEVIGYIESFKAWWGEGRNVIAMEKRFWCDIYKFTGQIDMIVEMEGKLYIVDIKTSSKPSKTWQAQGEAYYYLATQAGYNISGIIFLHLNKLGKKPKLYEYPPDHGFFFSVYRVFNHFFHKG